MKLRLLLIWCFSFLATFENNAQTSQDAEIRYLYISDNAFIPDIQIGDNRVVLSFSDPQLNTIVNKYTITRFSRPFKNSHLESLRNIFYVSTISPGFVDDLMAYSSKFSGGQIIPRMQLSGKPNDYGAYYNGAQEELDYINAEPAWNITTGNSNLRVGLVDGNVDVNHEDLDGKISKVFSNTSAVNSQSHGTATAGLIAAKTNNSIGLSSIGYNTKIDIYGLPGGSGLQDQAVHEMSMDGLSTGNNVRIVNNSWIYADNDPFVVACLNATTGTLYKYVNALQQNIYDEIYENGTTCVFSAGNGNTINSITSCGNDGYTFPASFDHNISVTSVGHLYDPSNPATTSGTESVQGVHNQYYQIPVTSHNHNSLVDISAPGYIVKTLDYNGVSHNLYGMSTGTSFAAPMVTGTLALMLAAKPCLTPYQLEYLLKQNANTDIYNIPDNQPYQGKLGAGRLDAGASVIAAKNFNCNDPSTQTMYIRSVDINTVCSPGLSGQDGASNGVLPKLSATIVNGTPPYTYRWLQLDGNEADLDNYSSATPTITRSWNSNIAYFLLTVTDQSNVPKTASQRVKIQLISQPSGKTADLAMRDSYIDMFPEPNWQADVDTREWNIWESPDIWNRKKQDGLTIPQDAEYFSSGDPNYAYVRVRNVGCAANNGTEKLRTYWTVSSTGEKWPGDWTTNLVPGTSLPMGGEITNGGGVTIPVLQPGDETIIPMPWNPKNPLNYSSSANVPLCLLARIEETSTPPYGMKIPEQQNVGITTNVRNNNNVVTRNLTLVNLGNAHARMIRYQVSFANGEPNPASFNLQLIGNRSIHPHLSGDLSQLIYVKAELGELFDRWLSTGLIPESVNINYEEKAVYFDPSSPLTLENITLDRGESFPVILSFILRDGVEIPFDITDEQIHFRSFINNSTGSELYGNVSFEIQIDHDDNGLMRKANNNYFEDSISSKKHFIYPNPIEAYMKIAYNGMSNETIDLNIVNVTGQSVLMRRDIFMQPNQNTEINTSSLQPGIYFVKITSSDGHCESYKVVKLK